jgi:hypothetical protein
VTSVTDTRESETCLTGMAMGMRRKVPPKTFPTSPANSWAAHCIRTEPLSPTLFRFLPRRQVPPPIELADHLRRFFWIDRRRSSKMGDRGIVRV